MKKYLLPFIIIFAILCGCAAHKKMQVVQPAETEPSPAGIDSVTISIADSIFSLASITETEAEQADKIFKQAIELKSLIDTVWFIKEKTKLSGHDSTKALLAVSESEQYLKINPEEYKVLKKMMKKQGKLTDAVLEKIAEDMIYQTIFVFETAIRKNKFRIDYKRQFSQFLKESFVKLKERALLERAALELEKAVENLKNNRVLFSDLGAIYWDLAQWQNAYDNYEFAKNVLIKRAIFGLPNPVKYFDRLEEVPVDTNRLVGYLYRQAQSKIKLYEAQPALSLLREAIDLTPLTKNKEAYESIVEWINWDDGNIRAVEIRDRADSLWHVKERHKQAKDTYVALLSELWTKRTKHQIGWNISTLDFHHLNNKDEGIARMMGIIKESETDSLTGAPVDSAYKKYFDAYGVMCFLQGSQYISENLNYAYIYFNQAANVPYNGRAKAFLQLADMTKSDAAETIRFCEKSMNYMDQLDEQSQNVLYQLLYSSYRKMGDFEKSKKWYDLWKGLN